MVRLSLVASAAWLTLANGVLGVWLDCGKAQYDPDHVRPSNPLPFCQPLTPS